MSRSSKVEELHLCVDHGLLQGCFGYTQVGRSIPAQFDQIDGFAKTAPLQPELSRIIILISFIGTLLISQGHLTTINGYNSTQKHKTLKEVMEAVLSLQPHIGDISSEENVVRGGGVFYVPQEFQRSGAEHLKALVDPILGKRTGSDIVFCEPDQKE